MKPENLKTLAACLLVACSLMAAGSARVDEALMDELTGLAPKPDRPLEELAPLYLDAFDSLKERFGSKSENERTAHHNYLWDMIHHVSQPGAEKQREVFCTAVAEQLKVEDYPPAARHILIHGLGIMGAADCVPTLASLLAGENPDEADLARRSLQAIPGAESEKALSDALASAGDNQHLAIGLIDSIAARGSASAAVTISPRLESPDPAIARAAANALGDLGGGAATKSLTAARSATSDPKFLAAIDLALLKIGNQRAVEGDREGAAKVFQLLGEHSQSQAVRTASMIGLARCAPASAEAVVIDAIRSEDPRIRASGISTSGLIPSRGLAKGLAKMLMTEDKYVQLQILNALAVRGDRAIQPQVLAFLESIEGKDRELEVATIRALGPLGSVAVVEMLLSKAVSKVPSIRDAAKTALGEIGGDEVALTIESHARNGRASEIRAVAVSLFMRNRDRSGLTRIMAFARDEDAKVAEAAIGVLRNQAGDKEFRYLLDLLSENKLEVRQVLTAVCSRAETPDILTSEIHTFLRGDESPNHQRFALGLLPILGSPRGLGILVGQIGDGLRNSDTAMRALSNWPTPDALPEMVKIIEARGSDRVSVNLMVRGITRLVRDSTDISLEHRVRYATQAFEVSSGRDRSMILQVIGTLPDQRCVDIIEKALTDPALAGIAGSAGANLAELLIESNPEAARALASKITEPQFSSMARRKAKNVLSQLETAP